jgi:hypothetical protein
MYRKLHIERIRLVRRLGRRGILLLLFGMAWMLIGLTGILIPQDRFSSPGIGPDTILQVLDGPEVSLLWIIAGAIAFTVGCLHDRRLVNRHEAFGWNAILTMPLIWMSFFVWSFVVWILSDGEGGRANGLYGAIVWTVVSAIIMIMAGWPEEEFDKRPPATEEPEDPVEE